MPAQQRHSMSVAQAPSSISLPEPILRVLLRSGAMQAAHSGRTLFDHLLGTYNLLIQWGQPQAVCLAGLFHSIYGTNAFLRQSLQASQRAELQVVIGIEAEALAWLFCNIDRPRAILRGLQQGTTDKAVELDRRRDQQATPTPTMPATPLQVQALAEIECANLIEQGCWGGALRELYCASMDQPGTLSEPAVAALREGWARQLAL